MKKVHLLFITSIATAAFLAPGEPVEAQSPVFRTRTDLVYLPVTVTDQKGRLTKGLKAENFTVYEEGVEQQLEYFAHEQVPITVGLVLDRSGSMRMMLEDVYAGALHVLDNLSEGDEVFAITFDTTVRRVQPMTTSLGSVRSSLKGLEAGGETALYDAIAEAIDYLDQASHRRRVLCVITDGEDNASVNGFQELLKRVEEADVAIYPVAMVMDSFRLFGRLLEGKSRKLLRRLAETTGGKYHTPSGIEECEEAMKDIGEELRWQYALGYYAAGPADETWRDVKVIARDGNRIYAVRTRRGYMR